MVCFKFYGLALKLALNLAQCARSEMEIVIVSITKRSGIQCSILRKLEMKKKIK